MITYRIVLCTIGVTTEAEAGMTIYEQRSGHVNRPIAQPRSFNVCKVCVCINDGGIAVTTVPYHTTVTARVSLLGEPWAVCLTVRSMAASFF